MPNRSAITEWSITRSAGASGFTLSGSPPRSPTASRMVARSTMQGTPVKSCMITRAGVNWISMLGSAVGIPVRDGLDVVLGDVGAVLGAQQVLGEHLEAVGEFLGSGHRVQAVDLVAVVPDLRACRGLRTNSNLAAHINSRLDVIAATGCVGGAPNLTVRLSCKAARAGFCLVLPALRAANRACDRVSRTVLPCLAGPAT